MLRILTTFSLIIVTTCFQQALGQSDEENSIARDRIVEKVKEDLGNQFNARDYTVSASAKIKAGQQSAYISPVTKLALLKSKPFSKLLEDIESGQINIRFRKFVENAFSYSSTLRSNLGLPESIKVSLRVPKKPEPRAAEKVDSPNNEAKKLPTTTAVVPKVVPKVDTSKPELLPSENQENTRKDSSSPSSNQMETSTKASEAGTQKNTDFYAQIYRFFIYAGFFVLGSLVMRRIFLSYKPSTQSKTQKVANEAELFQRLDALTCAEIIHIMSKLSSDLCVKILMNFEDKKQRELLMLIDKHRNNRFAAIADSLKDLNLTSTLSETELADIENEIETSNFEKSNRLLQNLLRTSSNHEQKEEIVKNISFLSPESLPAPSESKKKKAS